MQRDPRERDSDYCAWIATLPCIIHLAHGQFKSGVHVAHVRAPCLELGKRSTGMAEKPSDIWTAPICPDHHVNGREAQHNFIGGELEFWRHHGVDPFQLCLDLHDAHKRGRPGYAVLARHAALAHVNRNATSENQHG